MWDTREAIASVLPVVGLTIWTAIAVMLGIWGIYESENFYKLYPALWMPAIPITIVLTSLALPIEQKGIASILDVTPAHWLAFFQAGRISAIGTAYHHW